MGRQLGGRIADHATLVVFIAARLGNPLRETLAKFGQRRLSVVERTETLRQQAVGVTIQRPMMN